MCHALLEAPKFFRLLHRIDQELAAQARAGGCLFCDGVLHCAHYPRKPRACLVEVRDDFDRRFSFCCNRCRKRCTAMSVRFLGRRVYLGLAVVLVSARHAGQTPAAARTAEALAIPIRTLERWRQWWQTQFPVSPLWQAQCARFMPPRRDPSTPRRTSRPLCRPDGGAPAAPAALSHAAHRPAPDRRRRGTVITRRGCR